MTEREAPYRIPLDPCVRPGGLPAAPVYRGAEGAASDPFASAAKNAIEAAFAPIAQHLAAPPQAWTEDGRRHVQLWDIVAFSVARDGTDLQVAHVGEHRRIRECRARADLSQPIGAYGWPLALEPVIQAACRAQGLVFSGLGESTSQFIQRVLTRSFIPYVDWNRLRRQVIARLQLDPLVVSLTRRTFDSGFAEADAFNWVGGHARELALVATERPRLLPFLQLVSESEGPPPRAFDRAMREAGMTPAARRKLERWGFGVFSMAVDSVPSEARAGIVADFANLLDRLEVSDEPHALFAELVVRGLPGGAPDWYLRALFDEVQAVAADYPEEPMPADFELTRDWIGSRPPEPDDNQKAAGWPWIMDQAWKHRLATNAAARIPWPVPWETLEVDGYSVVPLRSAVELREEAAAMRNCLATYEDECRGGRVIVFSIRKGRRRVADFTAGRGAKGKGAWQVQQLRGKANQAAPEMVGIAARAVARLSV